MKEHMMTFLEALSVDAPSEETVRMLNPLKLAYLGDSIYEAYIRTYLMSAYNMTPHLMSVKAIEFVSAGAQAKMVKALMPFLTETEAVMVRRGRNQKSNTMPKNATVSDYRYATGFETLIGYLYLTGEEMRVSEIIAEGMRMLMTPENNEK